jgi:cytochrome c-type biogenesis protein CcmF
MFLVNNLLFVLLTFTVLIGTVFPLIVEAGKGKQMSVGRPYFDSMSVPLGALLLFILGVGPALPWGRANAAQVKKALLPPIFGAVLFLAAGYAFGARTLWTLLTLAFGGYAAQVTLGQMFLPMLQRMKNGDSFAGAFVDGQLRRGRRRFGSYIVHGAMIVVIIAVAISSSMRTQTELHFTKGQTLQAAGYDLSFVGVEERTEPHRLSTIGVFTVAKNGKQIARLEPRMNQYQGMREPIGSPDVDSNALRDVYISLSNVDTLNQTASITVFVSPFIVWIWLAVIVMALGAQFALSPARVRRTATVEESVGAAPETA